MKTPGRETGGLNGIAALIRNHMKLVLLFREDRIAKISLVTTVYPSIPSIGSQNRMFHSTIMQHPVPDAHWLRLFRALIQEHGQ